MWTCSLHLMSRPCLHAPALAFRLCLQDLATVWVHDWANLSSQQGGLVLLSQGPGSVPMPPTRPRTTCFLAPSHQLKEAATVELREGPTNILMSMYTSSYFVRTDVASDHLSVSNSRPASVLLTKASSICFEYSTSPSGLQSTVPMSVSLPDIRIR